MLRNMQNIYNLEFASIRCFPPFRQFVFVLMKWIRPYRPDNIYFLEERSVRHECWFENVGSNHNLSISFQTWRANVSPPDIVESWVELFLLIFNVLVYFACRNKIKHSSLISGIVSYSRSILLLPGLSWFSYFCCVFFFIFFFYRYHFLSVKCDCDLAFPMDWLCNCWCFLSLRLFHFHYFLLSLPSLLLFVS